MLFKLSNIPFEFQASNLMASCYKPMGKPKNVNVQFLVLNFISSSLPSLW